MEQNRQATLARAAELASLEDLSPEMLRELVRHLRRERDEARDRASGLDARVAELTARVAELEAARPPSHEGRPTSHEDAVEGLLTALTTPGNSPTRDQLVQRVRDLEQMLEGSRLEQRAYAELLDAGWRFFGSSVVRLLISTPEQTPMAECFGNLQRAMEADLAQMREVRAQRDELIESLEDALDGQTPFDWERLGDKLETIRAAIERSPAREPVSRRPPSKGEELLDLRERAMADATELARLARVVAALQSELLELRKLVQASEHAGNKSSGAEQIQRLEVAWLEFANRTLPLHHSRVQHRETRRAFYAGAEAAVRIMGESVGADPQQKALYDAHANALRMIGERSATEKGTGELGKA